MNRQNQTRVIAGVAAGVLLAVPAFGLIVVIATIAGGVIAGGGCGGDGGPGGGTQRVGPRTWSADQTANAQLITSVVIARALPRRAAVIALATAIVESGLRNLPGGDRDSLGLFQQRPSQGWGDSAVILNPASATAAFLTHLIALPGWATLPPGVPEQLVQRSANPGAYAPQEAPAAALAARFWSGPVNPTPPPPGASAPGLRLAALGLLGCPDQGGSNVPLPPGSPGSRMMPPGYQLPADPRTRAAVAYAVAALGKPYVWGATGPGAFDCSGLVEAAWAASGVGISRTTTTQVHDGTPVPGIDQVAPGDLLFIPGDGGSSAHPGHVGISAGDGLVIDAYDSRHGVIVERLAAWAPKIVAIRRVTPTPPPPPPAPGVTALAEGGSR